MPNDRVPLTVYDTDHIWRNKHLNLKARVERLYTAWNRWRGEPRPVKKRWAAGLAALRQIIDDAAGQSRRVRGLGGAWSLSDAAVTQDYMVDTKPLNFIEVGLKKQSVVETAAYQPGRLCFAQCGASVLELNEALAAKDLALPTSGASNGQTFVGAFSTGTHGAAHQVGSMQDFVVGLHILPDASRSVWLERQSDPVVSTDFCKILGAERIQDDALFDAAVVSFGSFGLIHGALLAAEPLYHLERHIRHFDYDVIRPVLGTLDVTPLGLPEADEVPFHLEVVLNPYATGPGEKGAYLRFMYKRLDATPGAAGGSGARIVSGPGDDAMGLVGSVTDAVPALIPHLVDELVAQEFEETTTPTLGTPGEIFGTLPLRGSVLSTEIGVALADAPLATDVILEAAKAFPFAGVLALRFVKGSKATLAFTRFDTTCTIELPAVGSNRTKEFFRRVWTALDDAGVAYTLHWGQCLRYEPAWLKESFGVAALESWTSQRKQFLGDAGCVTFSNQLVERCGLMG